MHPAEFFLMLSTLLIGAGTLFGLTSLVLKHRQRMAGTSGKPGDLRQTVQLLTETLERQHERQQSILTRLNALEAEREAARLALPATDEAFAPARAARVGVR